MTENKNENESSDKSNPGLYRGARFGTVLFWYLAGISCGFQGGEQYYPQKLNNENILIPKNQEMQQGYVQPNKLEVVLSDLDNDGKKEFMLKYEGKSYLMTYENGKLQIREYELKIPTKPSVEIKLK